MRTISSYLIKLNENEKSSLKISWANKNIKQISKIVNLKWNKRQITVEKEKNTFDQ